MDEELPKTRVFKLTVLGILIPPISLFLTIMLPLDRVAGYINRTIDTIAAGIEPTTNGKLTIRNQRDATAGAG